MKRRTGLVLAVPICLVVVWLIVGFVVVRVVRFEGITSQRLSSNLEVSAWIDTNVRPISFLSGQIARWSKSPYSIVINFSVPGTNATDSTITLVKCVVECAGQSESVIPQPQKTAFEVKRHPSWDGSKTVYQFEQRASFRIKDVVKKAAPVKLTCTVRVEGRNGTEESFEWRFESKAYTGVKMGRYFERPF